MTNEPKQTSHVIFNGSEAALFIEWAIQNNAFRLSEDVVVALQAFVDSRALAVADVMAEVHKTWKSAEQLANSATPDQRDQRVKAEAVVEAMVTLKTRLHKRFEQ